MGMDKNYRIVKSHRASFYSGPLEGDVLLVVRQYADGTNIGRVTCNGETLHFGTNAETFFNELWAKHEAAYMIMRAHVRAVTGYPD